MYLCTFYNYLCRYTVIRNWGTILEEIGKCIKIIILPLMSYIVYANTRVWRLMYGELFTQVTDVAIYTIGAVSSGTPYLTSLVEVQVFHLICAILLLFYFDWD